jgi:hypothetical protein
MLQHTSSQLPRKQATGEATQTVAVPVHLQYNMATSLGTADGLLLSLPTNPEGVTHEPQNPLQR